MRLPENAPGALFVDETCIDCDTCRQIAPATFARSRRGLSFVERQPVSRAETERALMALVACPTASIGAPGHDARAAASAFPEHVADGVFYCGYTAEGSFGASSYLVRRPEGNVLVDSPRAAEPLFRRIEAMGGVSLMLLTHRDDVADHRRFRERFGCTRVMHARDLDADTRDVELVLDGDEAALLAPGLLAVPVPGHTAGSLAFLDRERFLFTGDHLWFSETAGRLHASRSVCWYSWPEQRRSLERLLSLPFTWVLPGHGRRFRAASVEEMHGHLRTALAALPGA